MIAIIFIVALVLILGPFRRSWRTVACIYFGLFLAGVFLAMVNALVPPGAPPWIKWLFVAAAMAFALTEGRQFLGELFPPRDRKD